MSDSKECSDLSVLHVGAGRYRPGDSTHSTFNIWAELAKDFRRYTVVGRSILSKEAFFSDKGVDVHLLASRMESEAEFLYTQFKGVKVAEQAEADVVVAQCPVKGGMAGARIGRKYGAKVLMEFHGHEYFADNPKLSRNSILALLTHQVLSRADRIRVLSEGMRQRLLDRYGATYESRTVVLPPRVDLGRFSKFKTDWNIEGRPIIALVGAVNGNKGQLRFLEAVSVANLNVEVWIVGNGPDLDACKEFAARFSDARQVRFFGQIDHKKLADLLPKADIMVMFSRSEGTPRAIMEGMAVGLPIVTTDAGFCSDIVQHGAQGFVLGDDPMEEVIARLEQLIGDDELRSQMGRSARARATQEYDSVSLFERYRDLIRETASA